MNNRDPVMGGNALNRGEKRLTGIDLIYEYLKIIRMEKKKHKKKSQICLGFRSHTYRG